MNTNFDETYDAVERLCKTPVLDKHGAAIMADWLREGDWQNGTPAEIAAEWDELQAEAAEAEKLADEQ